MAINQPAAEYSISLIRAVMQGKPVPALPQEIELDALYTFARMHNVEAMMYHGLSQLNMNPQDPVWQDWENRASMLLIQSMVQLAERDNLFHALPAAGIRLLPFKGCWLKEQYPDIDYRQMSDLDVLIDPEKAQDAKRVMLSMGFETDAFENQPNHAGYLKPPYTEVELHTALLREGNEYYEDVWSRALPMEGMPGIYRFRPEDEYIYYLLHLNKHLQNAGTGIRSILDSLVYRSTYPDMDRAYLQTELKKLKLWDCAVQIETLADCWFRTGEAVPESIAPLAEFIMDCGSYGTLENYTQRQIETMQAKYKNSFLRGIVYWTIHTCRPRKEMALSYPVLNKLPVLLPFFWVFRAVMKISKHPKRVWNHITLVFQKGKKHG